MNAHRVKPDGKQLLRSLSNVYGLFEVSYFGLYSCPRLYFLFLLLPISLFFSNLNTYCTNHLIAAFIGMPIAPGATPACCADTGLHNQTLVAVRA